MGHRNHGAIDYKVFFSFFPNPKLKEGISYIVAMKGTGDLLQIPAALYVSLAISLIST